MKLSVSQTLVYADKDNFPLTLNEFVPEKKAVNSRGKHILLLIACATGCPRMFYERYARYMTSTYGIICVTFDYRGTGDSFTVADSVKSQLKLPADLTTVFPTTHGIPQNFVSKEKLAELRNLFLKQNPNIEIAEHYGLRDTNGVLEYLAGKYGFRNSTCLFELVYVAHSVGGHVLPLCQNRDLVQRVLLVSVNNAYRKFNINQFLSFYFFNMLMPMGNFFYGFFPAKTFNLFENIPLGVADQWKLWSKHEKYMCYKPQVEKIYREYQVPILALCFTDDEFSRPIGFPGYANLVGPEQAQLYHRDVLLFKPTDFAKKGIGHNGFFLSSNSFLWDLFSDYVIEGVPFRTSQEVLTKFKQNLKDSSKSKL